MEYTHQTEEVVIILISHLHPFTVTGLRAYKVTLQSITSQLQGLRYELRYCSSISQKE